MAESRVQVTISAKDQASSVFKKVGGSAADLGKTLAIGVAAGGAALAAGLGFAAKSAADFEKQMSGVGAVSGATASEMEQLSSLALQLGKDTAFSASEAASGLEELVKGGLTIPEIMDGAAKATLNLAAAGGTDLASAAEIAANALNTFNLSGADMAKVSDLIAGAANSSAIDVNDFKLSLAAAGAVTATVGGSFDDLSVAIAAMGNAGIKGSDAGTSLKTMLLNLQPVTDQQKNLMRELGIVTADGSNKFFDAQGKLQSFAEVSQVLQDALRGQTDQQKLATLETIFGSDAIRAAAVFTELGAQGFDSLAESMGKVSAEAVAAQRLNNLAGDMQTLSGSVETAAITLGRAMQPALRAAAQAATGFVNSLIPLIEQHVPRLIDDIGQAAQRAAEFGANLKTDAVNALEDFKGKVVEAQASVKQWADNAGPAGDAVKLAMDAAYDAADAFQALLKGDFTLAAERASKALDELRASTVAVGDAFTDLQAQAQSTLERIGDTSEVQSLRAQFGFLQEAGERLAMAFGELMALDRELRQAVEELRAALFGQQAQVEVNITGADAFAAVTDQVRYAISKATEAIDAATAVAHGLAAGFRVAIEQAHNLASAANSVKSALEAIPRNVTSTITTIRETVERFVSGERAAGGPVWPGGTFLVGERGPELFAPRQVGSIIPNHQLSAGGAGGGSTNVTVNVYGSVTSENDLVEKIRAGLIRRGRRDLDIFGGLA